MIEPYYPLESEEKFSFFVTRMHQFLSEKWSFKFTSNTLREYSWEEIADITRKHIENKVSYYVYTEDGVINGILSVKRDIQVGFEIYLLVVAKHSRHLGIGKKLLAHALKMAGEELYKSVLCMVFADNKHMLTMLIKNNFIPSSIIPHVRADGTDIVVLRKQIEIL